jgi:hypothetical protein
VLSFVLVRGEVTMYKCDVEVPWSVGEPGSGVESLESVWTSGV